jgi:hypothetical protein
MDSVPFGLGGAAFEPSPIPGMLLGGNRQATPLEAAWNVAFKEVRVRVPFAVSNQLEGAMIDLARELFEHGRAAQALSWN